MIEPARKRWKLWEIEPHYHCSIVGTCLTPPELGRIARRAGVTFEPDARDYHVHGFFVGEAGKPGGSRVGRLMHRALDDGFAGALRRISREAGHQALLELWDELCGKGEVAGAYRAFMSHAHVPRSLVIHVFNEVHMLSHFMGGHNRQHAKALWLAERKAEQLAEGLAKARRHAQETTAARDSRIAELEAELRRLRQRVAEGDGRHARWSRSGPSPHRLQRAAALRDRRLTAARARIRVLERDNQRLRGLVDALAGTELPPAGVPPVSPRVRPAAAAAADGGAGLEGRCLLYVGGRCQLLPLLRRHVEGCKGRLLHHDGGQEEALNGLEALVGRADIVFCPVDCVSHQACLKAKLLRRRLSKPFVPLRSSSSTCFLRAIARLGREGGAALAAS